MLSAKFITCFLNEFTGLSIFRFTTTSRQKISPRILFCGPGDLWPRFRHRGDLFRPFYLLLPEIWLLTGTVRKRRFLLKQSPIQVTRRILVKKLRKMRKNSSLTVYLASLSFWKGKLSLLDILKNSLFSKLARLSIYRKEQCALGFIES